MSKRTQELTEAEWAIIQAVWDHEPVPAPTVQELLEEQRGWSYSTVKTFMDRMVKKGLLTTERIRNLMLYTSAITREEAQSKEILKTLKRAFEGAMTPMMQFLLDSDHISHSELDELEAMIKARKSGART
ncbi:MAG: BlaI/MecI/CopY family transcriptional regulator [Planctomycetes bacterium]|nr:BlaI/MecI/CopY family transcriptional regulator [Planctomycetota bacterium]